MKVLSIAAAAIVAASAASAADFAVLGQTVSVGAEVDSNYNTGTEDFAIDFTPEAGFNAWGVDFTAETTIDVLKINEGDVFQGVDFEAGYSLTNNLRAYGKVGTDSDFEFGDTTVGVTFSF